MSPLCKNWITLKPWCPSGWVLSFFTYSKITEKGWTSMNTCSNGIILVYGCHKLWVRFKVTLDISNWYNRTFSYVGSTHAIYVSVYCTNPWFKWAFLVVYCLTNLFVLYTVSWEYLFKIVNVAYSSYWPTRPRPKRWSLFSCCNANVGARNTKYELQRPPRVNIMTTYWLGPSGSF